MVFTIHVIYTSILFMKMCVLKLFLLYLIGVVGSP
jgi:hypothetical protein